MAQHVFACATPRSLRDGLAGLRLPDTAVYPRFSLLSTSREAGGYACTSAPEGWGLHPHEDGVTRLCSLAACLEVRTSFQPTGHSPDLVVNRRTSDGESSSHRHFLFRQDVWTMFRRQISKEITLTISKVCHFTTKSAGIWDFPSGQPTPPVQTRLEIGSVPWVPLLPADERCSALRGCASERPGC